MQRSHTCLASCSRYAATSLQLRLALIRVADQTQPASGVAAGGSFLQQTFRKLECHPAYTRQHQCFRDMNEELLLVSSLLNLESDCRRPSQTSPAFGASWPIDEATRTEQGYHVNCHPLGNDALPAKALRAADEVAHSHR